MKNIVLINASPKINERSVSKEFLDMAGSLIDEAAFKKIYIDVRKSISSPQLSEAFKTLSTADAIIISFPLYVFCLPGILTRFLQDFLSHYTKAENVRNKIKVYAIVNCGFLEPEINLDAVRVIMSFSRQIKAEFRFGVLIGGGPMMLAAKDAPFMKKTTQRLKNAFASIAEGFIKDDLSKKDHIFVSVKFPFARNLYYFMGDKGWVTSARKNGLQKKDLYKKPYRLNE